MDGEDFVKRELTEKRSFFSLLRLCFFEAGLVRAAVNRFRDAGR
jgi:hypothetical protein